MVAAGPSCVVQWRAATRWAAPTAQIKRRRLGVADDPRGLDQEYVCIARQDRIARRRSHGQGSLARD